MMKIDGPLLFDLERNGAIAAELCPAAVNR